MIFALYRSKNHSRNRTCRLQPHKAGGYYSQLAAKKDIYISLILAIAGEALCQIHVVSTHNGLQ